MMSACRGKNVVVTWQVKPCTEIVGLTPSIAWRVGGGVAICYGTETINNRHIDWVTTLLITDDCWTKGRVYNLRLHSRPVSFHHTN